MSRCFCGMDHEAEQIRGADRSRHDRAERDGPPFETLDEGALVRGEPMELRARQREDGSWEGSVYTPEYATIPMLEVGGFDFVGIAATEDRAQALARQAAQATIAERAAWRANYERERREREASR